MRLAAAALPSPCLPECKRVHLRCADSPSPWRRCRIPATATVSLLNDPLMTYLKTNMKSRISDTDNAVCTPTSSGDAAFLNSFSSQSSTARYTDLEFLHVLGEGSFGRVRVPGQARQPWMHFCRHSLLVYIYTELRPAGVPRQVA